MTDFLAPKIVALSRRDWIAGSVIGIAVGLLIQPIIGNILPWLALTILQRLAIVFIFFLLPTLLLIIAGWLGELWAVLYQFAKFGAVGALNTFVDLGVLNLEIFLSHQPAGIAYSVFKAVSFLAATTNSFLWNKYWTFEAGDAASVKETTSFYAWAVVGWIVNVALASFIVNGIRHPVSISPNAWANIGALAGVAGAFLIDFLGYKFFVFKKKSVQ